MMWHFLQRLYDYPRRLFLLDGLGALLSASMLGLVLARFETFFGLPAVTLYFLVIFPILFFIYDVYCYYWGKDLASLLKVIAGVNVAYCLLSVGVAGIHYNVITIFGWLYIFGEVILVLLIAKLEVAVSRRIK